MKPIRLKELLPEITAHGAGKKFVFTRNSETLPHLTQVAYGILTSEDIVEFHEHASMHEYYYFLEGRGTFILGEQEIIVEADTFVHVPSGLKHKLTTTDGIKFFYFGLAV